MLYYQDRIGGQGIQRALVRAPAGMTGPLLEVLATRYGMPAAMAELSGVEGAAGLDSDRVQLLLPALGAARGR